MEFFTSSVKWNSLHLSFNAIIVGWLFQEDSDMLQQSQGDKTINDCGNRCHWLATELLATCWPRIWPIRRLYLGSGWLAIHGYGIIVCSRWPNACHKSILGDRIYSDCMFRVQSRHSTPDQLKHSKNSRLFPNQALASRAVETWSEVGEVKFPVAY